MFDYMYCMPQYNFIRPAQQKSYIRVLHASPDAPPVDVYANGNLIARNLPYRGFTEYITVVPGRYNIKVFRTGTMNNPVIDTMVEVAPGSIATVAAAGRLSDIGLFIVPDPVMPIPPGRVKVRFVHLSPNAPNVDVTLPDGTILFEDVGYEEITDYLTVDPAAYTLEARLTGTDQMILYVPNINLTSNRFYTVYAVGLVGESPPLQVLIPLDGNSYIKP